MIRRLLIVAGVIATSSSMASAMPRLNSVEYGFKHSSWTTVLANSGRAEPLAVYIPTTTARSIKMAQVIWTATDVTGAAASPTSIQANIGIDAVALSTKSAVLTMTNSGENMSFTFLTDFTTYFVQNFTASSHTVYFNYYVAVSSINNVATKLQLTYEYDDVEPLRLKTVWIPINSSSSTTAETMTEIGTNQVPKLDDFLPEKQKVYRDIFFEVMANEGTTAAVAADQQLSLALDAESADLDGPHQDALASSRWYRKIWKRTDMATNAVHAFKATRTSNSMNFPCLGAILTVTYQYDSNQSTTVINSVILGAAETSGYAGTNVIANGQQFGREFIVDESTPVMRQSGVLFTMMQGDQGTVGLWAGNQQASTYTWGASVNCGMRSIVHRVDNDNGFNVRQGTNSYVFGFYSTNSTLLQLPSSPSGILYLNYISSRSALAGGDANHIHTVFSSVTHMNIGDGSAINTPERSWLPLSQGNYWLSGAGSVIMNNTIANSPQYAGMVLDVEISTRNTGKGSGYNNIYNGLLLNDNEAFTMWMFGRMGHLFKRHPTDPELSRMDPLLPRGYRRMVNASQLVQIYNFWTFRQSSYTVTGTVSGCAGSCSGLTVDIYRHDTQEYVQTATTGGGGALSFPWYERTVPIFGECFEDSTHKGRSGEILADSGQTMDISLSGGAATPTTKGFGFVQ